jgi:hypothetical protein
MAILVLRFWRGFQAPSARFPRITTAVRAYQSLEHLRKWRWIPYPSQNRKKIGFRVPFLDYLSKDDSIKSYVFDLLNSQSFGAKKIWKADRVREVFQKPGDYPNFPFWRFINLEVWAKVFNIKNLYTILCFGMDNFLFIL